MKYAGIRKTNKDSLFVTIWKAFKCCLKKKTT